MQTIKAQISQQFCQLSLEGMIAKPCYMQKIKNKIPIRHACADPDNSNGGGGGGGGNCFSREVRTSFSSRKQMATYDFHGEVRTPCPLCLRPYQSFKQFEFTFYYYFFCWAWSIHKTSANYISCRQGQKTA